MIRAWSKAKLADLQFSEWVGKPFFLCAILIFFGLYFFDSLTTSMFLLSRSNIPFTRMFTVSCVDTHIHVYIRNTKQIFDNVDNFNMFNESADNC